MSYKGIDVSDNQGVINWVNVALDGVKIAILRSVRGSGKTDYQFHNNVNGCRVNGIPFDVYKYSYADTVAKAVAEAEAVIALMQNIDFTGTVWWDMEDSSLRSLGKATLTRLINAAKEKIEAAGYTFGIYCNLDWYNNVLDVTAFTCPFWIARYPSTKQMTVTEDPDASKAPAVKGPHEIIGWQYSSKGIVSGISGNVDLDIIYDSCISEKDAKTNVKTRGAVVNLANSWLGKNEADGSYKSIIDIYNGYAGAFPRNTKMQYGWAWCACTWSALAIKLGYTDIMPIEISCGYLIEAAKKMGCWQEDDAYIAKPGDAVLYDWDDSGSGDNTGWPDHVGTIVETNESAGYYVVTEGNYQDAVKKRTLSINGRYIRGFICPNYDADGESASVQVSGKSIETVAREVIAGSWGDGEARKKALESKGYVYSEIQAKVNEILNGGAATPSNSGSATPETVVRTVTASDYAKKGPDSTLAGEYKTTANLYLRHGAGKNKKAMVVIPKGTAVKCHGYYSLSGSVKWLYVEVTLDGVRYIGFSSNAYLKK